MTQANGKSIGDWLADFFYELLTGGSQANISSIDVNQQALNAGFTAEDLAGVDASAAYQNACSRPGVPAEYKTAPPPPPASTPDYVVRHIQTTQVTNINQNFTNIDASQDVNNILNVTGNVAGDIDFDPVTATGGSVTAGNDAVGATGDGSAATGSGPAAASGGVALDQSQNLDVDLLVGRGGEGGVPTSALLKETQSRVLDPIGPGGPGGAGGLFQPPPTNIINTGSGNQAANTGLNLGGQVGNFGDGAQNAVGNSGNVANSGNVQDFDNVTTSQGSAIGIAGGDITSNYDFEEQYVSAGDNALINQEDGPGDQTSTSSNESTDEPVL